MLDLHNYITVHTLLMLVNFQCIKVFMHSYHSLLKVSMMFLGIAMAFLLDPSFSAVAKGNV